jgi:hypothetical protein
MEVFLDDDYLEIKLWVNNFYFAWRIFYFNFGTFI